MARRKMKMSDEQIKFNMKWEKRYKTDLVKSLYATIGRDIKCLSDEEFKSKRSSDWDNYISEYKKWYIRTRKLSLNSTDNSMLYGMIHFVYSDLINKRWSEFK